MTIAGYLAWAYFILSLRPDVEEIEEQKILLFINFLGSELNPIGIYPIYRGMKICKVGLFVT